MELMPWCEEYNLRIPAIDTQHRRLVEIINELHKAMGEGRGLEMTGEVLQDLVDYTIFHFSFEEELLKSVGYLEFEGHKARHDWFAREISGFKQEWDDGTILIINPRILHFLKEWWSTHILHMDKEYAPHVRSYPIPSYPF